MIELIAGLAVIGGVTALVGLSVVGWGIGSYNTFRVGQQDIKTQWSNIKTEYQRRADLFYNLVQAVKSVKKFEQETYIGLAAARSGSYGNNKASEMKKLKGLDGFFNRLMAVMEAYPKLQAHEQYKALMEEIRITEDRINIARTDYNEIVGDYNKLITTFPKMIIASLFRFPVEEFFQSDETEKTAPKINLD